MTWYVEHTGDGGTHRGTLARAVVDAACGVRFRPDRKALPGRPAVPGQVCPDCDAAGCVTGRRAYRTEEQAQEALLAARVSAALHPNGERRERRCYPCRRCGNWHLTSQSRSTR